MTDATTDVFAVDASRAADITPAAHLTDTASPRPARLARSTSGPRAAGGPHRRPGNQATRCAFERATPTVAH